MPGRAGLEFTEGDIGREVLRREMALFMQRLEEDWSRRCPTGPLLGLLSIWG